MTTPFSFEEPRVGQSIRQIGHDLLPTSMGQSIKAAVSDPTLYPSFLLSGVAEEQEMRGELPQFRESFPGAGQRAEENEDFMDAGPVLSPEEVKELYPDVDLDFDEPVPQALAEKRYKQKIAEAQRQDILRRGPKGFLPGAARFGASIVATMADPLNIASAVVPVFGEARMAALATRIGTRLARTTRGATEGLVGAAAVEPAVFFGARAQDIDYTVDDAILNLALSSSLGAGIQVGGRELADAIARTRGRTRVDATRTALSQVLQGRTVEVAPVFRADSREILVRDFQARRAEALSEADRRLSERPSERLQEPAAPEPPARPAEPPQEPVAPETATQEPVREPATRPARVEQETLPGAEQENLLNDYVPVLDKKGELHEYATREQAEAARKRRKESGIRVRATSKGFVLQKERQLQLERDGETGEILTFDSEEAATSHARFLRVDEDVKRARAMPMGDSWVVARNATQQDLKAAQKLPHYFEARQSVDPNAPGSRVGGLPEEEAAEFAMREDDGLSGMDDLEQAQLESVQAEERLDDPDDYLDEDLEAAEREYAELQKHGFIEEEELDFSDIDEAQEDFDNGTQAAVACLLGRG